jgi:hypothetical protein
MTRNKSTDCLDILLHKEKKDIARAFRKAYKAYAGGDRIRIVLTPAHEMTTSSLILPPLYIITNISQSL